MADLFFNELLLRPLAYLSIRTKNQFQVKYYFFIPIITRFIVVKSPTFLIDVPKLTFFSMVDKLTSLINVSKFTFFPIVNKLILLLGNGTLLVEELLELLENELLQLDEE